MVARRRALLRLLLSCGVAFAALATSEARAAEAPPATLDYEVARGVDGCPAADELRGAIATRLGYDPFRDDAARRLTARIDRASGALEGRIELRDERGIALGSRSLRAPSCAELATSLAFAISMAIDPLHALAPPPNAARAPSPSPPPPTRDAPIDAAPLSVDAPAATPREAPPAAPRTTTPLAPRVHASVGAAGLGLLAGVSPLFALGAGLRRGDAAIDVEGRFAPASSVQVDGGTVRTSTLGVALLPCAHLDPFVVCGVVTVGALQGEAEGVDAPEKASTVFAQAGGRIGAAIRLAPRTTLEPFVESLATLTRTRLNFRGREVWSTSGLGVQGGLRLALHFP